MALAQEDLDSITAMINTSLNGAISRLVKTDIPKILETAIPKPAEPTTPTTPTTLTAQPDPKIAMLERQVADLTTANQKTAAEAKTAKRQSALDKALSTFTFANDDARSTAFNAFNAQVAESEDGTYVIGDQPLDVAVKGRMTNLTGLLAPKPVQGSGASGGHITDSTITEESIKPGMKPEDAAKAGALLASFWSPGAQQ